MLDLIKTKIDELKRYRGRLESTIKQLYPQKEWGAIDMNISLIINLSAQINLLESIVKDYWDKNEKM